MDDYDHFDDSNDSDNSNPAATGARTTAYSRLKRAFLLGAFLDTPVS